MNRQTNVEDLQKLLNEIKNSNDNKDEERSKLLYCQLSMMLGFNQFSIEPPNDYVVASITNPNLNFLRRKTMISLLMFLQQEMSKVKSSEQMTSDEISVVQKFLNMCFKADEKQSIGLFSNKEPNTPSLTEYLSNIPNEDSEPKVAGTEMLLQRNGTIIQKNGINYLEYNGESVIIPSYDSLQSFIDFEQNRYEDLQEVMKLFDFNDSDGLVNMLNIHKSFATKKEADDFAIKHSKYPFDLHIIRCGQWIMNAPTIQNQMAIQYASNKSHMLKDLLTSNVTESQMEEKVVFNKAKQIKKTEVSINRDLQLLGQE